MTQARHEPGSGACRGGARLGVWLALLFWPLIGWTAAPAAEVAETLRRSVELLRSTARLTVAGENVLSARGLPEIYESRGFRPLWNDRTAEEALLGEIAAAGGDGLDPADYHFDAIRLALERRAAEPASAAAAATAELLLTDALLRVAAHLHFGKLDPASRQPRWDLDGRIRGEPGLAVVVRMASRGGLAVQLNELRPLQPLYGRLKSALARYRIIEQEGGWPRIPPGQVLQTGMQDPRVALLRRRLSLTGDLRGATLDSAVFDADLEQALRRFQTRHQLEADGVLGPATLRALNRPVEDRIEQLLANLERARWLLPEVRGYFLLIDPAGTQVVLMDNSQPVLAQGAEFAPPARDAREFRSDLRYMVVHPDWVLPESLVAAQVAPLARDRPAELSARGLELFDRAGRPLEAARADWSQPGAVIVRQQPGPRSFLGPLRFSMPNPQQLFLHGGPETGEALPGSIRLANPVALAGALAGPAAGWSPQTLENALTAGQPRTLVPATPVPVLYAHWSAWVGGDGGVSFRSGLEQRDAQILAGLRQPARAR